MRSSGRIASLSTTHGSTAPLLVAVLLLIGCDRFAHSHEGRGEHDHGAHDAPASTAASPERPTLSVTRYQDGLELFMEYPAFALGESSPLVAHFTDARSSAGFRVVTQGSVTATLRYDAGHEQRFVANQLLRDGIFKPEVKPARAGKAKLRLVLSGAQVAGTVDAGEVTIHPSRKAAIEAGAAEEAAERAFPGNRCPNPAPASETAPPWCPASGPRRDGC